MLLGLLRATRGAAHVLGRRCPGRWTMSCLVSARWWRARPSRRSSPASRTSGDSTRPTGTHRRARAPRACPQRWTASDSPHAATKKAHAYSLGMKQRLGLANALLQPRELLVLDEPTNGLDPQGTREVRALIRSLSADGTTVFVSSHLLAEVEQLCTHVGVMSGGRLVAQGTLDEFRRSGGHAAGAGAHPRSRDRADGVRAARRLEEAGDAASELDARGGTHGGRRGIRDDRRRARRGGCTRARLRGRRSRASSSASSSSPGRDSMSSPEVAVDGAPRRRSDLRGATEERGRAHCSLLGNELSTQFRRWRTWAMLARSR